jgi:hypothetical protein
MTDEQIRVGRYPLKLGIALSCGCTAEETVVDRSNGSAPDFQSHEFNTIVDEQYRACYELLPRWIGKAIVVIAWNNHLSTMGEITEPAIEIANRLARKAVAREIAYVDKQVSIRHVDVAVVLMCVT